MAKTTKRTPDQQRRWRLAGRIALDLFTAGNGVIACQLALTDPEGRTHGGWGQRPVRDRIYAALERAAKAKR